MNIEAPLPKPLAAGAMPTILRVYVADDLTTNADRVQSVELRVHLTGAAAGDEVEVKLNGILLPVGKVREDGWCIFQPKPRHLAVGPNLVFLHLANRAADAQESVVIEKLEVHVTYQPVS